MPTMSLVSILRESARRRPDKVALVQGERRVGYAQLWDDSLRVAGALAEEGVGPGSRVAVLLPNVVEFVQAYYGILAAGGTVVLISPLLTADEARDLVKRADAHILLFHEALGDLARAIVADGETQAVQVATIAAHPRPLSSYVTRRPDDIAVIIFTSGTTGRPKGVLLSHLNLLMNVQNTVFDGESPLGTDDVVLACLPLFHIYGQQGVMNAPLRAGATLVLAPRFDPDECLRLIGREHVSVFAGVPTMFIQLLAAADRAEGRELPPMKRMGSGGSSMPVAVIDQVRDRFGIEVTEGYGLSETSPTVTVNQAVYGVRPGTVGHPVWGVEVEIADAEIDEEVVLLGEGKRGEVVVRGHCVFEGYLDDPEATAAAIQDGWFRTGDIGEKDRDGFLTIVDRKKDLIIRAGFNVYPREVEEVLMRHPNIAMAAVVGVPDAERGEEVMAFVTLREGASATHESLLAYGREHLGHHMYPRRLEIRTELPLGASMKVLRRELRDAAAADQAQDQAGERSQDQDG